MREALERASAAQKQPQRAPEACCIPKQNSNDARSAQDLQTSKIETPDFAAEMLRGAFHGCRMLRLYAFSSGSATTLMLAPSGTRRSSAAASRGSLRRPEASSMR